MKKWLSCITAAVLMLAAVVVPAGAAEVWPQFLGAEDSQGVSDAYTPVEGADIALRWEKITGNTDGASMSHNWTDVPGTPIILGDYVYYYSSQYLRKVDLLTGEEVAKVQVYGKPVNQFFINIAYGEGKIFVPCQTDNLDDGVEIKGCLIRAYDAETLEQLYVTEGIASAQPQSPVMYHDGYFVTGLYGRNGVYVGFTAEDEDPERSDEIKAISWKVDPESTYSFSFNGAAFVGDYCYFGCDNDLFVVNCKTGDIRVFDVGEGHYIRSTITYSDEMKRLYVATNNPDSGASVFSYELSADGMPIAYSARSWSSGTVGGGTQSTPVIYNGRLYLGGGGHTMGSNEPFHVIDAETMEEIYSVPILTKASAAISTAYATEENGQTVYIYLVPFAPNGENESELWILTDCEGQTEAKYEIVSGIGVSQYSTQSIAIASDGSLVWYNDAARLYCYENTKGIFDDTAKHWARENVAFLARNGIVDGIGNNMYAPDGTVTRAQFIQILAKMSGEDFSGYTTGAFEDVDGQWFAPAVAWGVEKGIVDTDESTYRPDEYITREDMALMLYRYVTNVAKAVLPQTDAPIDFKDKGEIAPEAAEAVYAMQRGGIINGIGTGDNVNFAPKAQATRAHAAAMISRFFTAIK